MPQRPPMLVGGWCVDQKEPVTFLLGKETQEILFRHHQLALEDAISERSDQTQTNWTHVARLQNEIIAELEVQHVSH